MRRAPATILLSVAISLIAPAGAAAHRRHRAVLLAPVASVVHPGQWTSITGRVRHRPVAGRVGLQERTAGRWKTVGRARCHHGRFTLRWRAPQTIGALLTLRVVAVRHRTVVGRSRPFQERVVPLPPPPPPPPTSCTTGGKPGMVPVADGWITGGLLIEGGPSPGRGPQCWTSEYTVTATNAGGQVVAKQRVPAGQGYTLVVPAGSYTLTAGPCHATATVAVGQETRANVICFVPTPAHT